MAYVLSKNLHRRHLTPSQASMVAARARDYYDRRAKERKKAAGEQFHKGSPKDVENLPQPSDSGKARDQAAKAAGVSGRTVDFATKVLKHGTPELVKAVDAGSVAVSKAATIAKLPKEKQVRVLAAATNQPSPPANADAARSTQVAKSRPQVKRISMERLQRLQQCADELLELLRRSWHAEPRRSRS